MFKFPVIDSHIHMYSESDLADIEKAAEIGGYEAYTLLSGSFMPQTTAGNLSVLWAKQRNPKKVYGYASLHLPVTGEPDAQDLLAQVKQYHLLGFDGIKMLDGKPSLRKVRVPLDAPCYDLMFSYLEENQIPVLYHSNDPIEFWDKDKIPMWAKDIYYYDSSNPTKRQITDETVGILKKHPGLNMTVAHFFFLPNTGEYELACQLMETYPNFFMDFTPGWEMFTDFHKDFDRWKAYIKKYSSRLVYGTDMNGTNSARILEPLRRALETDEVFAHEEYTCYGLNLDDESLKNIYSGTYHSRIQKTMPASVDVERSQAYAVAVKERIMKYQGINQREALKDANHFASLLKKAVL